MSGEPSVIATGRIATEPELKALNNGKTVCNFSLACTPRTKIDGEWVDTATIWFRCAAWGEFGETLAAKYVKGQLVKVEGLMRLKEFYKNGQKGTSFDLTLDAIEPVERGFKPAAPPQDDPWG